MAGPMTSRATGCGNLRTGSAVNQLPAETASAFIARDAHWAVATMHCTGFPTARRADRLVRPT